MVDTHGDLGTLVGNNHPFYVDSKDLDCMEDQIVDMDTERRLGLGEGDGDWVGDRSQVAVMV